MAVWGVGTLWVFWVFYVRMFRSSDIMIYQRYEVPKFFARTRDQLAVSAINSVVGLIIGIIFGVAGGPYIRELLQNILHGKGDLP